jgi:hypothetical protein
LCECKAATLAAGCWHCTASTAAAHRSVAGCRGCAARRLQGRGQVRVRVSGWVWVRSTPLGCNASARLQRHAHNKLNETQLQRFLAYAAPSTSKLHATAHTT